MRSTRFMRHALGLSVGATIAALGVSSASADIELVYSTYVAQGSASNQQYEAYLDELSKRTKLPKVGTHVRHATAEDKAQVLRTLDRAMATLAFRSEEKRETQRKVWRRLLGKSFLTKREAMALIGFLKKITSK